MCFAGYACVASNIFHCGSVWKRIVSIQILLFERMSRVRKSIIAGLLTGAFVLSAGAVSAEPVTLVASLIKGRDPSVNVVQDYGNVSWTELISQAFNKQYPEYQVKFITGDIAKETVAIAAGIGSDLINGAGTAFYSLGQNGGFIDITPYIQKENSSFLNSYWAPQMEAFRSEGRLFALPDYLGTMALYYNIDIFNNAGIPAQSTAQGSMDWDKFETLVKRLTRDLDGDGKIDQYGLMKGLSGDRMGFWLQAAGAEFYEAGSRKKSALGSEAAIKALEYIQRLRWESNAIRPGGVKQLWDNGGVAIEEGGSWLLTRRLGLQKTGAPKIPFAWNVMPLPKGPARSTSLATTDGWAINRNTKHPEAAYALLKFLAGPEANRIRAQYVALQPAHRQVVPEYIRLMQVLNRDAKSVDVQIFTEAAPFAYPQMLYADQKTADTVLNAAYNAILEKNQPARSVWLEAVERLNKSLAEVDIKK
jgi:multiple sugar transport system substrate-binding protein